ncbi:MAG: type IV pilus modification PilV family protein, partial [Candidatus Saccharicenans sp.]
IEVIVSLALVTVVFVSLAQLFTISIAQNLRSNEISNAIFLAQQQIDYLRTLTSDELSTFPNQSIGESNDELIDINQDGTIDFRRITRVQPSATVQDAGFDVLIMIFPPAYQNTPIDKLITNPENYKVRAYIHTIITR